MARNNPTRKKSGGGKRRSQKDQQRARYIKNETRTQGRCPICGKSIALSSLANHIRLHG